MQNEGSSLSIALRSAFGTTPVTAVEYAGKPAWLAVEVGRALGLADASDAAEVITGDAECEEGIEYHRLGAEGVAALRVYPEFSGVDGPLAHARHVIILTEPGLWRLIGTARVPASAAFRRWLYRDHLPALRAQAGRPDVARLIADERLRIGAALVDAKYAAIVEKKAAREQREIERGDALDVLQRRHRILGRHVHALRREISELREWATTALVTGKVPRHDIPPSHVRNYVLDDDVQ